MIGYFQHITGKVLNVVLGADRKSAKEEKEKAQMEYFNFQSDQGLVKTNVTKKILAEYRAAPQTLRCSQNIFEGLLRKNGNRSLTSLRVPRR